MENEVNDRREERLKHQPRSMGRAPDPELNVEHLGQGQEVHLLGQAGAQELIQVLRVCVGGLDLSRLPGIEEQTFIRAARGRGRV